MPSNTDSQPAHHLSRGFHFFLWTRMLSTAGNQMVLVALGWQMYDLTGSAWDLGLVGLSQFIPTLLFTIPAGQLADTIDRRLVLTLAILVQLLAAALLGWGSAAGFVDRDVIYVASVGLGIARAIQAPAQQAIVPALVRASELPRAMAMSTAAMKLAVIAGPAIGGFAYVGGPAIAYGSCTVIFVVSVGCALAIHKVRVKKAKEPVSLSTVFAGFRFLGKQPVVLGAISLDLFAVVLGGVNALLPIYSKDILHTGPWGLGLLRAAPAVGALLMAMLLTRTPMDRHVGRKLFLGVAVYGLSMIVFAFSKEFAVAMVALAVSGAGDMISIVVRQTLVQLETPDEMRGRVSAVNATFISTSNQLGDFRAGAVAALAGPIGSAVIGGVGTLIVVALWIRLFPQLAHRDRLVP
ncbi:MAG: MFS transporter [Bacillota bacterium]